MKTERSRMLRNSGIAFALFLILTTITVFAHELIHAKFLTPENSWELGRNVSFALAAGTLVIFAAAGGFLAVVIKEERSLWVTSILLAQCYLAFELILGGVWIFAAAHPTWVDLLVTYGPFFAPTLGIVAGAWTVRALWQS